MSIIRDITVKAQKYLSSDEILLFVGARQVGKTTILKQIQGQIQLKQTDKTVYFLNLEDPQYLELLNESPKNLFKIFTIDLTNKTFLFLDEIQYLENPSNFLKFFYDEYKGKIKILASGSSAFYIDKKFNDSLAGRKRIFNVFTLSFREFLRFKGEEDLAQKDFKKHSLSEEEKIAIYYNEYLIYGGYPRVVLVPIEEKINELREIAFSYIKKDIYEANIRQEDVFYRLFKILASQVGNLLNSHELALTLGVSKTAIDNYLYVMSKSFHIQLIRPFFQNIRKELTKMPKVYFSDLGLRNFFVNNFDGMEARNDKGALLENGFFRQLLENYEIDDINFWRTTSQNEVDFVTGGKMAFEVKTGLLKGQKSKYKIFVKAYPEIPLSFVTLDNKSAKIGNFPILKPWEV